MDPGEQFTQLLQAAVDGDEAAYRLVSHAAYARLREIAGQRLASERPNHTLQPTELVSEAWLKLAASTTPIQNRQHFLAIAAKAMRQILTDHARKRNRLKRGGERHRDEMPIEQHDVPEQGRTLDLLEVDLLLEKLEKVDPERARVVEMRLFAGMDQQGLADSMGLPAARVQKHLYGATAWLEAILNKD